MRKALVLAFAILLLAVPARASERVALVIGNAAYAASPLRNPVNDARDVSAALKDLGFDVILRTDADRRAMVSAVSEFGRKAQDAEVALFFYAGHGMQVRGVNYLIPVGATVEGEADVEFESMQADRVLAQMEQAGAGVNLVVLDACRDNPFRSFRSASRGLAVVRAVSGSVVVYATSPGDVAADGKGRNSPFTRNLLANIKTPGLRVDDVFKRVGAGVSRETGGRQTPWISSSLFGDCYLAGQGNGGQNDERRQLEAEKRRLEDEVRRLREQQVALAEPAQTAPKASSRPVKPVQAAARDASLTLPVPSSPVTIAVAGPFNGPVSAYGENIKRGVEMLVERVNAAGGRVQVKYFDEGCDPKKAMTESRKIAEDRSITGVVGHLCSSAHLAALPAYLDRGVPAISPTASNNLLGLKSKDRQGRTWSFRTIYSDDWQGTAQARYAARVLGLSRVGVVYENNDYGKGLAKAFEAEAGRLGLRTVVLADFAKGKDDFRAVVSRIKGAGAQAVFFGGYYTEGTALAQQLEAGGMTDVAILGPDGLDNGDYASHSGRMGERTFITTPFLPEAATGQARDIVDAFASRYGRDMGYMTAKAYDAAGVLLRAVEAAGPDRERVRAALSDMDSPDKAFKGITGPVWFNAHGDYQGEPMFKTIKDGRFVAAEQMP